MVPDDANAAIEEYRRAISIARDRNTKLLELRATSDLSRLWAKRGDRRKAKALLAPVHDWFSGGFDKPDLQEAKALLEDLA